MLPLTTLLLYAFAALAAGLAGGVGGRALATRLRFSDVWDAIDALSVRIARREGQEGKRRALENTGAGNASQAALLKALQDAAAVKQAQARGPELVLDEEEGARLASERYARDGRKKAE